MSFVQIVVDRDDGEKSRCGQLLAVHELRRHLERRAAADGQVWGRPMAVKRTRAVRELLELIAALDRRAPHMERAGEAAIANDAAALKARALKRIEELEASQSSVPVRSS
jgi:hypothetical protein